MKHSDSDSAMHDLFGYGLFLGEAVLVVLLASLFINLKPTRLWLFGVPEKTEAKTGSEFEYPIIDFALDAGAKSDKAGDGSGQPSSRSGGGGGGGSHGSGSGSGSGSSGSQDIQPWFDTDSPQVKRWVDEQRKCKQLLFSRERYASHSKTLAAKIQKHVSFKTVHAPFQKGCYYFYYKQHKQLSGQPSLYYTKDIKKEGTLLLDAKGLHTKGLILRGTWVSEDGLKVAYGISNGSCDNEMTIYIRDVLSCQDSLVDVIYGCRASITSISWLEAHIGFFYSCSYNPADINSGHSSHEVFILFHRLNTEQVSDLLIYKSGKTDDAHHSKSDENRIHYIIPIVSHDGNFLVLEEFDSKYSKSSAEQFSLGDLNGGPSIGNAVHFRDVSIFDGKRIETIGPLVTLINCYHYRFEYIANLQDKFWFRTNHKAPRFRIVQIIVPLTESMFAIVDHNSKPLHQLGFAHTNIDEPTKKALLNSWQNSIEYVAEEREDSVLLQASVASRTVLVLKYLQHSGHEILLYDLLQSCAGLPLTHAVATLPHPQCESIVVIHCNYHSPNVFYQCQGFSDPGSVYRAIVKRNPNTNFIELSCDQLCRSSVANLDLLAFDSTLDHLSNPTDGSEIPYYLFENKDGSTEPRPCILFAYGGFGVATLPSFSLPLALFVKYYNAVVCVVNVRGGGEKGRAWHISGLQANKSKSVEDLVTVAQYLVKAKITSKSKLGIFGGSHGGFLAAACMIERPDLFGAGIIEDGLLDLSGLDRISSGLFKETTASSEPGDNGSTQNPWVGEFGSASSPENRSRLLDLSPLHNISALFEQDMSDESDAGSDSPVEAQPSAQISDEKRTSAAPVAEAHIISSKTERANSGVSVTKGSLPVAVAASAQVLDYPAVMLLTDEDSPVPTSQSFKFIAELQSQSLLRNETKKPFVIRIELDSDRGEETYAENMHRKFIDILTFFAVHLDAHLEDES